MAVFNGILSHDVRNVLNL